MSFSLGSAQTTATLAGEVFDVFTYKPTGTINGILLVFHGTNRDADVYRDHAIHVAVRKGLAVAAPLFDATRWPNEQYQRANVLPGSVANTWTTRFVPPLITWAKGHEGELPVYLFGFSAGGQFLSRVAAFEPVSAVRIAGGGASTFVRPMVGTHPSGEQAPYGMGGIYGSGSPEQAELTRYIETPYSILVGGVDNDSGDPDLTHGEAPDRQGTDRRDRAENTYAEAVSAATSRGDTLGWQFAIMPRLDHSPSRTIASRAFIGAIGLRQPRLIAPNGEALIASAFAAGNTGIWLDPRAKSRYHTTDSSGVEVAAYGDLFGRGKNRGNLSNGKDLVEVTLAERPFLRNTGIGPHHRIYAPCVLSGVGANTGDFYAVLTLDSLTYAGIIFTDINGANTGKELKHDGDQEGWLFSVGNGSARTTVFVHNGATPNGFVQPPLTTIEVWYKASNGEVGIRRNRSVVDIDTLSGTASAGTSDMWLAGNSGGTQLSEMDLYHLAIFNSYLPVAADKDAMAIFSGSLGGQSL